MKKIYLLVCIIAISFACSESFLEEELVSTLTSDYFDTPQGLNECLNASYNALRWRFNGEHGYSLTNYGVDEMTDGNGPDMLQYNNYDDKLDPDESDNYDVRFWGMTDVWQDLYYIIKLCNIGIESVESMNEEPFHTEALRQNAKAQFLFLRAFSYFDLVVQFGSVPLLVENTNKILTDLPKSSVEDIYKQIIADFEAALPNLDVNPSKPGRITRGAARHYLAKVYLYRASEVNRNWNTNYQADLQKAIEYAEQVLPETGTESIYALEKNYASLFNYTVPDGPNESSKEIILAAQFTDNLIALGDPLSYHRGNKMHLYIGSWYEDLPGLDRDLANGRPWRRLCATDYAYDVFDRENDSRFYKSFKFAYMANVAGGPPIGDTAVIYIVNSEDEPFDQAVIDTMRYRVFARYVRNAGGEIVKNMPDAQKQHYPPISKYFDPTRPALQDEEGYRDGILARLAETYLIAAEAHGRLGNYGKAMEYINVLRTRAAYKDGEARQPIYYMIENDNKSNPGTAANLLIADAGELTSIPSDPLKASYFPPSVDTPGEIFIAHILDERARELMCELHRWADLARTETLIERATLYNGKPTDFNGSAQPIAGKHELRPIPQSFIDALQKEDGTPYSAQERLEYQNPGY
ncbi:MAG: hypothetical protein A2Y71_00460 [Bacteroidetes bacterium RBG_13_42_15]|nr:MAG: hypothetical protein A2Y71_00460 [Bacteroidetes bacterium RBG_13_42_15]